MNLYGEGAVDIYTPDIIYENIENRVRAVSSFIGWGDAAAEFLIHKNGEVVGGAHSSDQQRYVQVWYDSPIMFGAGDIMTITAEIACSGTKTMRCNILGQYI